MPRNAEAVSVTINLAPWYRSLLGLRQSLFPAGGAGIIGVTGVWRAVASAARSRNPCQGCILAPLVATNAVRMEAILIPALFKSCRAGMEPSTCQVGVPPALRRSWRVD